MNQCSIWFNFIAPGLIIKNFQPCLLSIDAGYIFKQLAKNARSASPIAKTATLICLFLQKCDSLTILHYFTAKIAVKSVPGAPDEEALPLAVLGGRTPLRLQ